jgi:hypothetical protein
MKAFLSLFLVVILRAAIANAQPEAGIRFGPGFFYKYKNVELISQQPLVVLLSEEDPKELKKLANKPEELAEYKADIAYLNTKLRQLAPQVWKFSPAVEFKPESVLPALQAAGQRTVVLYYQKRSVGVSRQHVGLGPKDGMWQAILQLSSPGGGEEHPECNVPLPLDIIYASDIVVALKQIQQELRRDVRIKADANLGHDKQLQAARDMLRAEGDANAEAVRTKLLLVAQEEVDEKLTPDDIKRLYPFPVQLVPRATIEEAVRVSDVRYNYVRWRAASMASVGPAIIAAADGRVLGYSADGGLDIRGRPIIGKREFKDFAQYANAKASRQLLGVN